MIDGKEVVHQAVPADEMTQAFFYKHVVPASDLTLVPEDRVRFREEAARAAEEKKPATPPPARRTFQHADGNPQRATGEDSRRRNRGSAGSPGLESQRSRSRSI